MNLHNIVSITGMPGLFKVATNRSNGLIVQNLETKKTQFVSARKHQFTPLESIALYTLEGTEELYVIMETIKSKVAELPLPEAKAPSEDYMQYFDEILPNYDEDKVRLKDMKKVVKWFKILDAEGLTEEENGLAKKGSSEEE